MTEPQDLREELRELVASLREHVAWQAANGSDELPTADPAAALQALSGRRRPSVQGRPPAGRSASPGRPEPSPSRAAARRAQSSEGLPPAKPQPYTQAASGSSAPGAAMSSFRGDVASGIARYAAPQPPESPLTVEEKGRRLVVLSSRVRDCVACGLHAGRKQTVFARGNPNSELCFVGEGPGADEDEQGEPFVGKAGQLLDRMIVAMGYARDDVYICNVVKCRPPDNRRPDPAEMAACAPYLGGQLELVAPKVIVALGATAVQGLLGSSEGITRLRGKWKLYRGLIPVMPTFHPAYLLRQPSAKRDVWSDLQAVMKQLGKVP